jgi:hypothetical protein
MGDDQAIGLPVRSALRTLRTIGPTAVALVALVSSAVAVAFALWPALKPDPRERLGAQVGVYTVETHVSRNDWLHRISGSRREYARRRDAFLREAGLDGGLPGRSDTRRLLGQRGTLFYVTTTIEGFKRRSVQLRWSLYGARHRQRVGSPGLRDVTVAGLRLDAPTDRSFVEVWAPPIVRHGTYFARFELVGENGTLLAVADSPRFAALLGDMQ